MSCEAAESVEDAVLTIEWRSVHSIVLRMARVNSSNKTKALEEPPF